MSITLPFFKLQKRIHISLGEMFMCFSTNQGCLSVVKNDLIDSLNFCFYDKGWFLDSQRYLFSRLCLIILLSFSSWSFPQSGVESLNAYKYESSQTFFFIQQSAQEKQNSTMKTFAIVLLLVALAYEASGCGSYSGQVSVNSAACTDCGATLGSFNPSSTTRSINVKLNSITAGSHANVRVTCSNGAENYGMRMTQGSVFTLYNPGSRCTVYASSNDAQCQSYKCTVSVSLSCL